MVHGLLSSCGTQALECAGSVVVVRGLSCPATAYGILVPRTGIEPVSPALEGRFLTTGPPGKSPEAVIFPICTRLDRYNYRSFQKFNQVNKVESNWKLFTSYTAYMLHILSVFKNFNLIFNRSVGIHQGPPW